MATVFRARHVATLAGPVIEDGCIRVETGRIVEIGPTSQLKPPAVDYQIDGVLLPGLINAHTHLELTNVPRPAAPASFADWILAISRDIRGDPATFEQRRAEAVRQGVAQCVKFGVTTAWDISQNVEVVRPVLRDAPIRSVSFGEGLGIGARRERFDMLLNKAIDPQFCNDRLSIGISPHAPYTVDERGYARVFQLAESLGLPVMTHLAETPDEARFLHDHGGSLGALYAKLGTDPGDAPRFVDGPIAWLRVLAGEGARLRCAHVNYIDDEEIEHLAAIAGEVIWCPRTHAYFGHPPHRWQEIARACPQTRVRIGTDSCASSPDLNIVDDLRLVHSQSAAYPIDALWRLCADPMRTGENADLVAFETRSADPLREIVQTPGLLPSAVWVGGSPVFPM